jgi:N-acetylmuramoyl-L-alanine amidase
MANALKVFLDPGHGGTDPGALWGGIKEKDITLYVGLKTRQYLEQQFLGVVVAMSRATDKTLTLKQRTDMANEWEADLLLSIHVNAGGGDGYEDFVYNKLSVSSDTNKKRMKFHEEMIKVINDKDRGAKFANFHMLRESNMTAWLTENLFIDNPGDNAKLKNKAFLDALAQGHANGIAKAYGLTRKPMEQPKQPVSKPSEDVTYRVVTGSFEDRDNAEKRVKDLEAKGFDSFIDVVKK